MVVVEVSTSLACRTTESRTPLRIIFCAVGGATVSSCLDGALLLVHSFL